MAILGEAWLKQNAPDELKKPGIQIPVGTSVDQAVRHLVQATLDETGSFEKAAPMLGISLKTLYNWRQKYGIEFIRRSYATKALNTNPGEDFNG